ncbi:MAG: extracellular solute-binding protein [Alphaproteobacteria bacterium]|nr:extracellular solute-binding protein [Alphaproteobacteria bacterium]
MTLKKIVLLSTLALLPNLAFAEEVSKPIDPLPLLHGISMHQDLKYPKDFKLFDYVNPNAKKGGDLHLRHIGTFDSLNPYLLKGTPSPYLMGRVYGSLMKRNKDEPFSLYGFIAESIQVPEDRSYIIFHINPLAKFEDGTSIKADDVVFTFNTLKEKAGPHIKMLYNKAKQIEKLGDLSVKLILDQEKSDRETVLLLAMMPVFSKNFFDKHVFEESSHIFPLSSGPYRVKKFNPGKEIEYERVKDFWAENLPCMKGQNNFDNLIVTSYRDENIALESFKSGGYDLIHETDFAKWEKDYDIPAVKEGKIKKIVMPFKRPMGMFGIALNMRRPPFDNLKLRQGLITLFDHQWMIENYYNNSYVPSTSFFSNCDFEAKGQATGKVKEILETYKDKIPPSAFDAPKIQNITQRERLRIALKLFDEAGWQIIGKNLTNIQTKEKLSFEILIGLKPLEKICLAYANMLQKAGIDLKVRYVDSTQFNKRKDEYDFDAVIHLWGVNYPGKELNHSWSTEAANKEGARNYPGIKNPVIDDLIQKIIEQTNYDDYVAYIQSLDRVLWSGDYLVPLVYWNKDHFAYWNKFKIPDVLDTNQGKLSYLNREEWAIDLWETAN